MTNVNETLIATATKSLGNEAQAKALTSAGRAFASNENSTKKVVKAYADNNTHPAFFVSPYDKQGNVNKGSKSQATPEQFDAQRLLFAAGMGNCDKGLLVTTNVELISFNVGQADKRISDAKEAAKHAKDTKLKAKLSEEVQMLKATKTARNALLRKIGPKFRDLANALITEYKRRAKADAVKQGKADSNDIANDYAKRLKEECGFASIANKEKPSKEDNDVILQQAKNLLNALQKAEVLPVNGSALIKELSVLLEPKH